MQPWLNGTTVSVSDTNQITQYQKATTDAYYDIRHKTVNIYSFSLASWQAVIKRLNQFISEGSVNCYYETVFAEMIDDKSLAFESVSFDSEPWYEIDTLGDLAEAEKLFPKELKTKVSLEKAFA